MKEVGLWVDHHNAIIVSIENDVKSFRKINSNLNKRARSTGTEMENAANDSHEPTAEDMEDRKYSNHLDSYYQGIISQIRTADSIWIFGPGEAKVELENALRHEELGARIEGIETVDKMTDRQIEGKVLNHFLR